MIYNILTAWEGKVIVVKSDEAVNQVLNYIEAHLEEKISINDLAKRAGYSNYHFERLFKSHVGVTVMEYICGRRLIKASEDILSGQKIIDIAIKYGWKSHSGFTKAFSKKFGFCPSLLRAMKISIENLGGSAMNHVFLGSTRTGATKEELFDILQEKMKNNGVGVEEREIVKIYQCACNAFKGVKRYSGEEYVTHLLNVSIILTELGAGAETVLAAMFSEVEEIGVISLEKLRYDLPGEVYDIIVNVHMTINEWMMASDEVILIRLAERLHNMRTIEFLDDSKRKAKAIETIEIFMPLARKLENKKLIDELNDLCVKYI